MRNNTKKTEMEQEVKRQLDAMVAFGAANLGLTKEPTRVNNFKREYSEDETID